MSAIELVSMKTMPFVLSWLMISCRESTRLSEIKLLRGIGWWDGIKLTVHQKMCVYCKYYENQSLLIDKALQNQDSPLLFKLDEASKSKIKERLSEKK
jgi:hypothetical protein